MNIQEIRDLNKRNIDRFALGFLQGIKAPVNQANVNLIRAWQAAENAGYLNNPLATTQPMPNSSGSFVKTYPDLDTGIKASVKTIQNGFYPDLLDNFRQGNDLGELDDHRYFIVRKDLQTWCGCDGDYLRSTYLDRFKGKSVVLTQAAGYGAGAAWWVIFIFLYIVIFGSKWDNK